MTPGTRKHSASPWTGYAISLALTAFVIAFRWEVNHLTGELISMPLCGLAVVIAATRLGTGPGVLTAVVTTAWCVRESLPGAPGLADWFRCAVYGVEASLACVFSRQLRIARQEALTGEAWHRQVIETSGEGIWMVGADGVIGYANPRIAEILGCSVAELAGKRVEDFLFPEDLAVERIRFQSRRPTARDQFDRRLRRSDGTEVWTLACSSPYARQGKDSGVLTMMTDITERKKAEQSLRRSERKFRELFENIREGVYQTAPDGRILAANPELLRMLGFSTPEELNVPGVVRDTFVDPEVHLRLREKLERDGSYANIEFQLRTRDLRIITVRENARVVRDDSGNVAYYEGTLTDLTDHLRFEKYIRQAREMEALGALAGGIARDFRSIGLSMQSALDEALAALPADSPERLRLHAVDRAVKGAERLTSQILDFSQRQMDGADSVIDINAFVREIEPELQRHIPAGTELALTLADYPLPALADISHLQQIVSSFVIHAAEPGSAEIALRTSLEEPGPVGTTGAFVRIAVVAPFTADSGRRESDRRESDLWVGSETTQAILARYGGTARALVEARSARYELYLPLAAASAPLRQPSDGDGSIQSLRDVATVLLMDEDPLLRELSRDMLERQGFRVLSAGTPTEAERIARGPMPFGVLVTPWATDNKLVHSLHEIRPGLQVLFIAGYEDTAPDAAALPPASAILAKPFSGNTLGRETRRLMEKKG